MSAQTRHVLTITTILGLGLAELSCLSDFPTTLYTSRCLLQTPFLPIILEIHGQE
jgi:hypothetical protein